MTPFIFLFLFKGIEIKPPLFFSENIIFMDPIIFEVILICLKIVVEDWFYSIEADGLTILSWHILMLLRKICSTSAFSLYGKKQNYLYQHEIIPTENQLEAIAIFQMLHSDKPLIEHV